MNKSRIPSPARSLGPPVTPRRYKKRGPSSVGSVGRSSPGRLTGDSIQFSPLQKTVLSDDTDIDQPRRSSWWKKLDTSRDMQEVLDSDKISDIRAVIEDVDMEVVASAENKEDTIDLPESSNYESVHSIVVPQRKFLNKENQPQKKTNLHPVTNEKEQIENISYIPESSGSESIDSIVIEKKQRFAYTKTQKDNRVQKHLRQVINRRQSKNSQDKTGLNNKGDGRTGNIDKEIEKDLPLSQDKTLADKTRDMTVQAPPRVLFGTRAKPQKNVFKDMFSAFVASESEDEISDIQPTLFAFQKNVNPVRHSTKFRKSSPRSSITTDIEFDEWKLLPSSTMVEHQLEVDSPASKRARLSQLLETKKSGFSANIEPISSKTRQTQNTDEKDKIHDHVCDGVQRDDEINLIYDDDNGGAQNENIDIILDHQKHENEKVRKSNNVSVVHGSKYDSRNENQSNKNIAQEIENQTSERIAKESVEIVHQDEIKDFGKIAEVCKNQYQASERSFVQDKDNDDYNNKNITQENEDQGNKNITQKSEDKVENAAQENVVGDENENDDQENEDQDHVSMARKSEYEDQEKKNQDGENENAALENEIGDENENDNQDNEIFAQEIENEDHDHESMVRKSEYEYQEKKNQDEENENDTQENEDEDEANDDIAHDTDKGNQSNENLAQQTENEDQNYESMVRESEYEDQKNENTDEGNESDTRENEGDDEANDSLAHDSENKNQSNENLPQQSENDYQDHEIMARESEYEDQENENPDQGNESDTRESEDEDEANDSLAHDNENKNQGNESLAQQSENDYQDPESMARESEFEDQEIENPDEGNESDTRESEDEDEANDSDENQGNENLAQQTQDEYEVNEIITQESEDEDEANEVAKESETEANKNIAVQSEYEEQENVNNESDVDEQIEEIMETDQDIEEQNVEEEKSPNETHDTTGRQRNKNKLESPEVPLSEISYHADSFVARGKNTSIRKTTLPEKFNIRSSMAPPRDSTGMSDGTKNSSAEGSGWDSHRTTRKTLRQTFGKDFTPRKSLRALVMEKSAKRRTIVNEANAALAAPQANSTELPQEDNEGDDFEMIEANGIMYDGGSGEMIKDPVHEVSMRTRQTNLENYWQNIKKRNMEIKQRVQEQVRESLKTKTSNKLHYWNTPSTSNIRKPKIITENPEKKTVKKQKARIPLENLPPELVEDLKYKPPKRFKPRNAPWITKRLYKFLETTLEPKYDYKARVVAEKLVETLYNFVQEHRKDLEASPLAIEKLKKEFARLKIVKTHYEFYNFIDDYLPAEVIWKVVPDIGNKLPQPENIFGDIIY